MKPVDPIADDLALANEILESLPGKLPNANKPPRNAQNATIEPGKHSGEPGKHPKKKHAHPSGDNKPSNENKPKDKSKKKHPNAQPHAAGKPATKPPASPSGKLPASPSGKLPASPAADLTPALAKHTKSASIETLDAAVNTGNITDSTAAKTVASTAVTPTATPTATTTVHAAAKPPENSSERSLENTSESNTQIGNQADAIEHTQAASTAPQIPSPQIPSPQSPVTHIPAQAQAMPSTTAQPKLNPMPATESVIESVIESTLESAVETTVESAVESVIEPAVESKVEPTVEHKADHKVAHKAEPTIESKAKPSVKAAPEVAVDHSEAPAIESQPATPENNFALLGLQEDIVRALTTAGYLNPTDIQAATIPALLEGRDVLGQAQTGTGKTAAFALPLLSRINVEIPETQVLVLAPTRELAIQVSESFLKYGQHLRGLRVAPIYGGSGYTDQIHALRRGAHVVVGTPGRVMDHMRESRLRIDTLSALVLDEADEMLRMGFVDDVQWILDQSPENRQIALFSATMPEPIRHIANKHLKNPKVVTIASKQRTGDNIEQRFLVVDPKLKLEALTRVIEAEEFDGMIIFVKTKIGTVEVADYLREHGYQAVALNGDIAQAQRERTIEQLKEGVFNILVATDVAARGLDVQRITHVINFDLPPDAEAYVHRIGRTGRAGRRGQAIVFVAPKQRGFLREIDRAAGDSIEPMAIPNAKDINAARVEKFKDRMNQAASKGTENPELFSLFEKLIAQCVQEQGLDPLKIATGLAVLAQGDRNFYVHELPERLLNGRNGRDDRFRDDRSRDDRSRRSSFSDRGERSDRGGFSGGERGESLETFRVEVGRAHGVKPGNIVGAIANEIGLDPSNIGQIRIENEFSTVDLPAGMPRELFKTLGRAWVLGRQLRISKLKDHPNFRDSGPERSFKPRKPGGFARSESGRSESGRGDAGRGDSGRDESSKGDFSRTNRPPNRSSRRK